MRLGNFGTMLGAALVAGAMTTSCRHGSDDRDLNASRSTPADRSSYAPSTDRSATDQTAGMEAPGSTYRSTDLGKSSDMNRPADTNASADQNRPNDLYRPGDLDKSHDSSRDSDADTHRPGMNVYSRTDSDRSRDADVTHDYTKDLKQPSTVQSSTPDSSEKTDPYGRTDSFGSASGATGAMRPADQIGKSSDSGSSAVGSSELQGDAIVHFTAKDSDQNLTGMAAFTAIGNGTRLVVDLNNAKPGRYEIALHEDGNCDMTSGSSMDIKEGKSPMHKTKLGKLKVDKDGRGHFDKTLTQRQLNYRTLGSLENQALILKRSKAFTSTSKTDGIEACGVVTSAQNRTPSS